MCKKVTLAILLAVLPCLALAACATADAPPPTPPVQPSNVGNFEFTPENFPYIGGSLAAQPLAEAVIATALSIPRHETGAHMLFEGSTTSNYRGLIDGQFNILLAYEPSDEAYSYAQEQGFEWESTAIGRDALVFIVNKENPVDNITDTQVRGAYSGKISNWQELGGLDSAITPYQRNKDSGSQTLFDKLVNMGDDLMAPPSEQVVGSMLGLLEVVADYDNAAAALGYTVYYYLAYMEQDKLERSKILSVGGVACNNATIASSQYPYVNDFYVVIPKGLPEDDPARVLYNWICSEQGKELAERENYVSVL
jgi:phosphate transport system substrate-binding protein